MEYEVFDVRSASADSLQTWFSEADTEKQARLLRFRREADRVRGICADHLARAMLAKHCGCEPAVLSFTIGENGKPFAAGTGLHFNVSHSGSFVCCAVHNLPLGIDIEELRPIRPALAGRVCAEEELCFVCPEGHFDSTRFLQVWTAKEAYLKCTGEGIAVDLRRVTAADRGRLRCEVRNLPMRTILTEHYALAIVCRTALSERTEMQSMDA